MSDISVNNIDYNKVYSSNDYGDFIFLEEVEPYIYKTNKGYNQKERMAKIKFLDSGNIVTVRVRHALKGSVKDPYYPKICGVACIGNTYTRGDHRFLYDKWKPIIYYCYGDRSSKEISISQEWLCFENFINDAPYLDGYNEMISDKNTNYILQKDANSQIYSKDTCRWIPTPKNNMYRAIDKESTSSKYYGVVLSEGKYKVQSTVRDTYMNPIGVFTDEIAAVNMREYFRDLYYPSVTPNENYPHMPINEALQYKCVNKRRKPLFGSQMQQSYCGIKPVERKANRWKITDVAYNGNDLGIFINIDAALSVREYYRAIYYPHLPKNYNYNHMPIHEALRFKYHTENPKVLFTTK